MQRRHRAAHRRIWTGLLIVLPALLLLATLLRQAGPMEAAPVQLAAPK